MVFGYTALADGPADADQIPEIVVTAQKRTENLQTVPVSITTFGSQELKERAVENFMDYATSVPNLGFGASGDGAANSRTISIRGVSGDNTTGFYLDETPLPDSLDPRIVDIDHIEVLRGPQGTLYGARSMGGTVRLLTNQPDAKNFSAGVHTGISSTEHTHAPNYLADGVVKSAEARSPVFRHNAGRMIWEAGEHCHFVTHPRPVHRQLRRAGCGRSHFRRKILRDVENFHEGVGGNYWNIEWRW